MLSGQVSRGDGDARVRLKLEDGTTYPVEGTLQFADVTVDPTTGSQTIRAVFPNPSGLLLPGMFVRAELVEGTQRSGMLVPQRAVSRDERGRADGADRRSEVDKVEPRIATTSAHVGDDWLVTRRAQARRQGHRRGRADCSQPGAVVNAQPWQRPPGRRRPAHRRSNAAMSRYFIDRPIFAWVHRHHRDAGGRSSRSASLPIAQFPVIAPPSVAITAIYPGADAETLENTTTQIIEQQMKGIDHLRYFSSSSSRRRSGRRSR